MNHLAVVAAAASSFLLGGLWYSKVAFGDAWNRANGGVPPPGHPAKVFGISFALALAAAYAFAWFLGPAPALKIAVHHGLLIGVAFVATSFGINYQFAQRPARLWLIDGGYHVAQFVLFGLILGLWH